jgi:hypothetical protein
MPTYERLQRFDRDYDALSPNERRAFKEAVQKFVDDLERGQGFRRGLRVKGVRGAPGVFEMTWADDGRATFSFGKSVRGNEPHVVWHRVGSHAVL